MPRSELLGSARIPDTTKDLLLYKHQDKFSIVIPGRGELMNSRVHGSEIALAELACGAMESSARPRLLVGGLGMGFTLAAALGQVGEGAEVVVAELVPEVVAWNRDLMGEPSGHPLKDPRSTVFEGDIAALLRDPGTGFDAIMMDVQLPDMSGLEITDLIRKGAFGPVNPKIFIAAMTAFALPEDRRKCLDAGCNDYISKPVETPKLKRTLARAANELKQR